MCLDLSLISITSHPHLTSHHPSCLFWSHLSNSQEGFSERCHPFYSTTKPEALPLHVTFLPQNGFFLSQENPTDHWSSFVCMWGWPAPAPLQHEHQGFPLVTGLLPPPQKGDSNVVHPPPPPPLTPTFSSFFPPAPPGTQQPGRAGLGLGAGANEQLTIVILVVGYGNAIEKNLWWTLLWEGGWGLMISWP